jgi:hypothetical protein
VMGTNNMEETACTYVSSTFCFSNVNKLQTFYNVIYIIYFNFISADL